MMTKNKRYSELIRLNTYEERLNYLMLLDGSVGVATFGFDRYLNQDFYKSKEWKRIRHHIITRDMGCDMGLPDYEIFENILIHHMNPITKDDILQHSNNLLDPENLICVSKKTHNLIHYGNTNDIPEMKFVVRYPNDQCLWRK